MEGVVSADILEEEILPRVVEVKTLLRLRCVSKSWRSWIDSKRFINELQPQHSSRRLWRKKFITYLCDASDDKKFPITEPSTYSDLRWDSIVVGHHNGLLCMLNLAEPSQFFIWNPATRIYTHLPLLEGGFKYNESVKLGFGWDEEADAYKVFVGIPRIDHGHEEVKIYSSKIKSWTTMVVEHTFLRYTYLGVGVFVCGKM